MPSPQALYLIRHGETDWNAEGRLQGQRDVPLNARGRRQADEVGAVLAHIAPGSPDLPFVASPMARTRETMERLRRAIGLDPLDYTTDDRLKELTFGRWEGLTWREVRRSDPAGAARRERDKWGFVPPAGESYAMLEARVAAWLATLAGPTVVVAHGGVARVLLVLCAGWSPDRAAKADIWQGRVLTLADCRADWSP